MEGVPEGNILAIARVSGTQKYLRTTDYFATIDYTLEQAFALLHHKKVIFVVRPQRGGHSTQALELWSSVDGGSVYSRAIFPNSETINEKKYTVVDLDEGEAFVNVELDTHASYGTTFGSDSLDREFSEVLRYAVHTQHTRASHAAGVC
jgi:hypothetical protein